MNWVGSLNLVFPTNKLVLRNDYNPLEPVLSPYDNFPNRRRIGREWTKLLDTKFDLLNSIPETHGEVEENQHKAVLWLLHAHRGVGLMRLVGNAHIYMTQRGHHLQAWKKGV